MQAKNRQKGKLFAGTTIIAALFAILLMVLMTPSGVIQFANATASNPGTPEPYAGGTNEPAPIAATQVTISSANLSSTCGQLCYPTAYSSTGVTAWSKLPFLSLGSMLYGGNGSTTTSMTPTGHMVPLGVVTQNTTGLYPGWSGRTWGNPGIGSYMIAPGLLQNDPFPAGSIINATTNVTDTQTGGNNWWNSSLWGYQVDINGTEYNAQVAHPAASLLNGAVVHKPTAVAYNGVHYIAVGLNGSKDSGGSVNKGILKLNLSAAALTSTNISNDWVTVEYSMIQSGATGGADGAPSCAAGTSPLLGSSAYVDFGAYNASFPWSDYFFAPHISPTYPHDFSLPTGNCTTGAFAPQYSGGSHSMMTLEDQPVALGANYTGVGDAGFIDNNETVLMSVPLSDLTDKYDGLNITSAGTSCTSGQCTSSIGLGWDILIRTAAENVTLFIEGIAITSHPVTFGNTWSHSWINYSPNEAAPSHYTVLNESAPRDFYGGYWDQKGASSNFTFDSLGIPSGASYVYLPGPMLKENVVEQASSLAAANATVSVLGNASANSATFDFAELSSSAPVVSGSAYLSWSPTVNYYDTVRAGTYSSTTIQINGGSLETATSQFSGTGYHNVGNISTLYAGGGIPAPNLQRGAAESGSALIDETVSYPSATFCALFTDICTPTKTGNSTGNSTSPLVGGETITVTGQIILIALIVLAGVVALAWWAGEKDEKRKMGKRGVGRLPLRRNRLGMAKRYISRSKEAYEHDAAGTAWMIVIAVLGMAAFFGILDYGILGVAVTMVSAAALTIVLLVLLVLCIVAWEATKEPVSG
jgi:hypothetical protein